MKDLETKVEDLEKASDSANHENSMLRAQIEKMSMELREYRKRLSLNGTPALSSAVPPYLAGKGLGGLNNPSDVNFQFEFPKFGRLPGPPPLNGSKSSTSSPGQQIPSPLDRAHASPRNQSLQYAPNTNGTTVGLTQTPAQIAGADMSSLSGLFSPTLLESVAKSPSFEFFPNSNANGSRSSVDSISKNGYSGNNTSYSSPSASSNSVHGASSSCGTSPEPTTQSPAINKMPDPTLTTIGEENSGEGELTFCDKLNMACGNSKNPIPRTLSDSDKPAPFSSNAANFAVTPSLDINGIDWFAQQNNNQFDPQLFGDYREPQESILQGTSFSDNFFIDDFALPDFQSPYNMAPSPAPPKKDLVAQIDETQEKDDEVVPAEDRSQLLNCNTIWYILQPSTFTYYQLTRDQGSSASLPEGQRRRIRP